MNAVGSVDVNVIPRIYGASELGVLSITAPGEIHPRVEYVAGEVFVGLDDDGSAITRGQAEQLDRPFGELLDEIVGAASTVPDAVDGVIVIADERTASAVLTGSALLPEGALTGSPVLFALARDRFAVTGSEDEAGIARVLALAEELYEGGRPLVSAHPLALLDGAWEPFPWRERVPAAAMRFERVLRLFSVRAYEAQTAALQRPDVHLADPKIRVLESGVTTTFAAWPQGTATLLPVVDNVIIADPGGSISVTTFDEFLTAGGDAIVRTGLSPLRYFVPGEPPR